MRTFFALAIFFAQERAAIFLILPFLAGFVSSLGDLDLFAHLLDP